MAGITHEWNGTVLTITSDSGTSSCDLKGEKGDDGARGAQGAAGSCIAEDAKALGGIPAAEYVLKEDIPNIEDFENIPDLSDYALKTDLEDYVLKSEIPTLDDIPDMSNVALKTDLAAYALKTDLDEYAKLEDLPTGGSGETPDLSAYALKTDLEAYAKAEDIPSLEPYALKTDLDSYAKEEDIPSLEGYALKTELPNLEPYALKTDLEDYALKSDLEGLGGGNGSFDVLSVYPVGSIYLSVAATSPASLFGGSWTQLKDRFLLAAGDTYTAGSTGGEATHALTVNEMPNHTHEVWGWKRSAAKGSSAAASVDTTTGDGAAVAYNRNTGDNPTGMTGGCITPVVETGGNAAHNNMPPYLTVYMWQRIA